MNNKEQPQYQDSLKDYRDLKSAIDTYYKEGPNSFKPLLMKYLFYFLLVSFQTVYAQDKMIVNQDYPGSTFYGGFSTHIDALSELPPFIQLNLTGYQMKFLGSLSNHLSFSQGQVIDLEKMFATDSLLFEKEWIVPSYDLTYILRLESIGIQRYYLKIRLDKFGQLIAINWPRKKYNDLSKFISRQTIKQYALKQAEIRGFEKAEYQLDFSYNPQHEQLCWKFKFPISVQEYKKEHYVFEIPWSHPEIIDEYRSLSTTYR